MCFSFHRVNGKTPVKTLGETPAYFSPSKTGFLPRRFAKHWLKKRLGDPRFTQSILDSLWQVEYCRRHLGHYLRASLCGLGNGGEQSLRHVQG